MHIFLYVDKAFTSTKKYIFIIRDFAMKQTLH